MTRTGSCPHENPHQNAYPVRDHGNAHLPSLPEGEISEHWPTFEVLSRREPLTRKISISCTECVELSALRAPIPVGVELVDQNVVIVPAEASADLKPRPQEGNAALLQIGRAHV